MTNFLVGMNMNTELIKRLEEAAEEAGIKAFNNAYDNLETGEVCALCQEIAVENHRAGSELGYKEAIAQAKDWLKNTEHFYQGGSENYPDVISMYHTIEEMVADFETDMNKILEEKK